MVVELGAEVEGVLVGHDKALVVLRVEDAPGELVEPELLRTAKLDGPVDRVVTAMSASAAATSSAASGCTSTGGK